MSTTPDVPNPLRPYHIPQPAIKHRIDATNASTATIPKAPSKSAQAPRNGLGSSAREMFSDIDYSDYIPEASPSILEVIKGLLDQALWKYTSVLMAQPFDLAKVILQVQDAGAITGEQDGREQLRNNSSIGKRPYEVGESARACVRNANFCSYLLTTRTMILSLTSHLPLRSLTLVDAAAITTLRLVPHRLLRLDQDAAPDHRRPVIMNKQVYPLLHLLLQLYYLGCGERKAPGESGRGQMSRSGTVCSSRPSLRFRDLFSVQSLPFQIPQVLPLLPYLLLQISHDLTSSPPRLLSFPC